MTEVQLYSTPSSEGSVSTPENDSKTLPSMPLLYPPSQPGSPVSISKATTEDDPVHSASSENELEMSSPEKPLSLSPKDSSNDAAKDSSNDASYDYTSIEECDEVVRSHLVPFGDKRKPPLLTGNSHPPPKKKKKVEAFDLSGGMEEEPGSHYAEVYFSKVKSTLDESTLQKFITILSEAKDEPGGAVALYKKIEELFVNFPELAEDFVGTLRPDQALEIGKLLELKFITRSLAFFKKLEGFQLTKVIHALETLASNSNLTEELVKSTILSILKGHAPLAESFLHLLPNEKPPPPSSLDDYEDITEAMLEEGDDGGWESARIPEHAERGCLSECPCRCHTTPSQPFCLECNIRFIKGQAYVQYGKVIRYCKIQFGDMTHDEVLQRFNPALYSKRRRKRKSISKTSVPSNEASKEVSEVIFQDENAVISKEDVQRSSSPGHVEDKIEEEDDYWEEDDVSSGDKSSGGDMYEEMDRHSEDTEDRLIGQLNNPLSPLGSTVEGFYVENGSGGDTGAVRGVVIDVSDIRPNGVNTHVFKFETRVSDDPCIQAPETPEDKTAEEPLEENVAPSEKMTDLREATVVIDSRQILPQPQNDTADTKLPTPSTGNSEVPAGPLAVEGKDTSIIKPRHGSDEVIGKSEIVDDQPVLNDSRATENGFDTVKDSAFIKIEFNNSEAPERSSTTAFDSDLAPSQLEIKMEPELEVKLEETEGSGKPNESDKGWTRQEDKMILEAFQREIGTEETFARIRNLMPARSVDEIQERFQVLMNLLEKVASGSHDAHPS